MVDVASHEFLGVRSATGLHRIGAEGHAGCGLSAYHYFYGGPVDTEASTAVWRSGSPISSPLPYPLPPLSDPDRDR